MRISKHFMKGCYLLSALLMFFPIKCYATTFNKAFRSCINMRKAQALSLALTHSDTIPLRDIGVVYALSIDATITQPRESSFVRIVLEDVNGHNYLVAESDCFRNDTSLVQLSRYCEETALLDARPYKSTSGGKVIVKNGGKILCHKKTDFTLPIGIMLDVDEGCIVE